MSDWESGVVGAALGIGEFASLIGRSVALFCMNYTYAGCIERIEQGAVVLSSAGIVYETGELTTRGFQDFQRLPGTEWRVRISTIESYGEMF